MTYPTYQINLPAPVRFDKNLLPNAKLLYGEIKALCDQQGYCWAGNDHLSTLYGVKPKVVSRWINQLCKFGYLHIEVCHGNRRKIYITSDLPEMDSSPPSSVEGIHSKVEVGLPKSRAEQGLHLIYNIIDYNDRINSVKVQDSSTKKWREQKEKKAKKYGLSADESKGSVSPSPQVAPGPPPKRETIYRFLKPSAKEVEVYMKNSEHCQDGLTARSQSLRFVNYYEANGWKVGRNPMQDWQAAANNWLFNAKEYATHTRNLSRNDVSSPNFNPYASRLHSGGTKDYSKPL